MEKGSLLKVSSDRMEKLCFEPVTSTILQPRLDLFIYAMREFSIGMGPNDIKICT